MAKPDDAKTTEFKFYLTEEQPQYLTRREAQCMYLIMQGLIHQDIAQLLQLSIRTIEFYLRNIRVRLGCRTRKDLLQVLLMSGFMQRISPEQLFSTDQIKQLQALHQ